MSRPKTSSSLITTVACAAVLMATGPAASAAPTTGASHKATIKTPDKNAKAAPTAQPVSEENAKFSQTVDAYFDELFKFNPTMGTELGLHQYDSLSADFSADGIQKEGGMERTYRVKFKAFDPAKLSRQNKIDREVMIGQIESQLLELEVIQNWKKNPDLYTSAVTAGVFSLIKRNYAPIELRMSSAISRAEHIPATLAEAKKNLLLDSVPRVFADVNIEQLPGVIDFFESSVPDAFKNVSDPTLRQTFASANLNAIAALKDYQKFVTELVAKGACKGNFALGAENYTRKLKFEQMVDTPLDKLLSDGYDELHNQQKQFRDLAQKVAPGVPVDQYFQSISKDHPKADQLISSVTSVLDEIKTFCVDKNIVTIPASDPAKVAETPPFDRALSFASMDTPGPFETKAREAFYYVTLPESGWSAKRTEEHLRSFSYPDLINTSVHEAYPGHYVQFLWSKQFPSKTRKIVSASSNVEGWAHYCEQMMLDQGLHNDDTKLRMVQLHDALLRNCRYIVAIEMHTRKMTVDQAIEFFMKEGYMEKSNAEREAKRGTMDPTYLVYTLGKMQILSLRDDYQKLKGDKFSLKEFHDRFLKMGPLPLRLVRTEMLNEPVPNLLGSAGSTQ